MCQATPANWHTKFQIWIRTYCVAELWVWRIAGECRSRTVWGGLGRSKAVVTWRDETVEKQASARRSGAARPCI